MSSRDLSPSASPTLPENQPTGGCPQGYADWCLAREIVKTVKTVKPPTLGGLPCLRRSDLAITIRFDSTLTGDYTTHTLTGKTLTVTAHGGGHFTGALRRARCPSS